VRVRRGADHVVAGGAGRDEVVDRPARSPSDRSGAAAPSLRRDRAGSPPGRPEPIGGAGREARPTRSTSCRRMCWTPADTPRSSSICIPTRSSSARVSSPERRPIQKKLLSGALRGGRV
jgi:hypothetical protein